MNYVASSTKFCRIRRPVCLASTNKHCPKSLDTTYLGRRSNSLTHRVIKILKLVKPIAIIIVFTNLACLAWRLGTLIYIMPFSFGLMMSSGIDAVKHLTLFSPSLLLLLQMLAQRWWRLFQTLALDESIQESIANLEFAFRSSILPLTNHGQYRVAYPMVLNCIQTAGQQSSSVHLTY